MAQAVKREKRSLRGLWARCIRRLPLRQAFVVYVLLYLLLAFGLIVAGMNLLEGWRGRLVQETAGQLIEEEAAPGVSYEVYYYIALVDAGVSIELADGSFLHRYVAVHGHLYSYLGLMEIALVVLVPAVCLWLAAHRFYRRKLREPLNVLHQAAERIGRSDLDFAISYDSPDELGRLCADFERMRSGVLMHETELWRSLEDRRRQTAALSHDLRTPLTVLKGQAELLESALPPGRAAETVRIMRAHILRMERYVAGLNELRRLESIDVHRETLRLPELAAFLASGAELLCHSAGLAFAIEAPDAEVSADTQLIQRIFDNLLSNATRYARARVLAELTLCEGRLLLTLRDDGPGLSEAALTAAAEPFWSESKTGPDAHLGLGLNIARTLCERLGGRLLLGNGKDGGAMVTADLGEALPTPLLPSRISCENLRKGI